MTTMSLGGNQLMQYENQNINAISLLGFFNNFLKYIVLTYENRAYTKIRNYINVTIQKGEKYAAEIAKAQENQSEES